MPQPYTLFSGALYSNYTIAIGVSILLAGTLSIYRLRREAAVETILDLYVLLLITALISGRAFYVMTHFDYYSDHWQEIASFDQGGVDWHGVVWANCFVLWLFARWKQISFSALLNAFAPALPIIMFGAWWGCHAASCAYGQEIQNMSQYPSLLLWEGPDIYGLRAPRFYTQSLGTLLAFALFVGERLLSQRQHLRWNRFGSVLGIASVGLFCIGFLRGDDILHLFGLRADQWLDVLMLIFAGFLLHRTHATAPKTGYDSREQSLSSESD